MSVFGLYVGIGIRRLYLPAATINIDGFRTACRGSTQEYGLWPGAGVMLLRFAQLQAARQR